MLVRFWFPVGGALLGILSAYLLGYNGALLGLTVGIFAAAAYALGVRLFGLNR